MYQCKKCGQRWVENYCPQCGSTIDRSLIEQRSEAKQDMRRVPRATRVALAGQGGKGDRNTQGDTQFRSPVTNLKVTLVLFLIAGFCFLCTWYLMENYEAHGSGIDPRGLPAFIGVLFLGGAIQCLSDGLGKFRRVIGILLLACIPLVLFACFKLPKAFLKEHENTLFFVLMLLLASGLFCTSNTSLAGGKEAERPKNQTDSPKMQK